MKRVSKTLFLLLVITLVLSFAAIPVFAADDGEAKGINLQLTESYPKNNDTHMQIDNPGIKLYFSGDVTAASVWGSNEKCFTLKSIDEEGKTVQVKAYPNIKENYILVVTDSEAGALIANSNYELTISENLISSEGKTLGQNVVLNFKTVDVSGNSKVYMLLMVVMIVAMIVMNIFDSKRKAKTADAEAELKVNPYKYAKEKGITVQEAMDRLEKERAKKAKKAGQAKGIAELDRNLRGPRKRVKGARPISAAGSTYTPGAKKSKSETKNQQETARRAKGVTNPKRKNKKKK